MSKSTDWMPYSRQNQLAMAKNWLSIFSTPGTGTGPGGSATPADKWGIPYETVQDFGGLIDAAEKALTAAREKETGQKPEAFGSEFAA